MSHSVAYILYYYTSREFLIGEQLIFYNITRCYSDFEYCQSFAIAAGDIVKYQLFV